MDQLIEDRDKAVLTLADFGRLNPDPRRMVLFVGSMEKFNEAVHVAEHLGHIVRSVPTFHVALTVCHNLHPVPDVVVFEPDFNPERVTRMMHPHISGLEFAKRLPQQGPCGRIRLVAWTPSNSTAEAEQFVAAVKEKAKTADVRFVPMYTRGKSDLRPLLDALRFD